jgi:hypothetical protein
MADPQSSLVGPFCPNCLCASCSNSRKRVHDAISTSTSNKEVIASFSQPTTLKTMKIFKDPSSYRNVWTHKPEVISDIPPKPFKIDRRTVTYDHKRILRQLIDTLAKLVFFVQLKVDRTDIERLLPKKIIVQVFKELPEKLPTGHYLKKKPCRDEYECLWAGYKGLPHQVLNNISIQIFNKSALESKGKVN